MSADSPRTASQPKPATQYPMTEEEIAQAAERQSNLLVLRKVAPYLWPDDMPWVKKRVVWALIFLVVSKLISVVIPVLYKDAVDALANEGVPFLALGAVGLTIAYGMARAMNVGFQQLRDAVFARVGQRALRMLALETFEHIHKLSMRYHITRKTGGLSRIIERGVKGVEFLLRFLLFSIGPLILELLLVGIILVLLGLLPKMAAVVEGIPLPVLGGAGVALFGMVAASGVRTLTKVAFNNTNILVVAISVGVAMLTEAKLYYTDRALADAPVNVALDLYHQFPDWFQTIFHSGISAGAITAILLNLLLNTRRTEDDDGDLAAFDAPRGALPDPRDALRAADPSTPPEELEALAHKDSGLHTIIVTNPSTYVTTCEWIRAQGSPQVDQVYLKWDAVTEGRFSRRSRE